MQSPVPGRALQRLAGVLRRVSTGSSAPPGGDLAGAAERSAAAKLKAALDSGSAQAEARKAAAAAAVGQAQAKALAGEGAHEGESGVSSAGEGAADLTDESLDAEDQAVADKYYNAERGEYGGPTGLEPTRFSDWEKNDDDFDPDEDGCEVEEEEEDELHPGFSFGRVFPLEPVRGSVTLPCLAFESEELLLPGHTRTVHLHEARHLALLDEALLMCDKRLCLTAMEVIYAQDDEGNVELDEDDEPIEAGLSFPANLCVLSYVEHIQRLHHGVLVTLRGEQQMNLTRFEDTQPYLRGTLDGVVDDVVDDAGRCESEDGDGEGRILESSEEYAESVAELADATREAFEGALVLAARLSPDEDDGSLEEMMEWVDRSDDELVRASRLSFAAMAEFAGATESETLNLATRRVRALETVDTRIRLSLALHSLEEAKKSLAAKVAINDIMERI